MSTPKIQIFLNEIGKIELFWDFDKTNYYKAFNLYGSSNSSMSTPTLIKGNILNAPDTLYDKNKIFVRFDRSLIHPSNAFYVQLKGIKASDGSEDSFDTTTGPTRIPALTEKVPYYDVSMMYAYTGGNWIPFSG
jgi:hypothetical protein